MENNASNSSKPSAEFNWIKYREEMNPALLTETAFDRIIRKSTENPFVPLGKFY